MATYDPFMEQDLRQLANGDQAIEDALLAGFRLSGIGRPTTDQVSGFFSQGNLGRVSEETDPLVGDLINKLRGNVDTRGARSQETNSALGQLFNAGRAPIMQGPQVDEMLDRFLAVARDAKQLTPDEQLALDTRRNRLQGFSDPELNALREQQLVELNRAQQTALEQGAAGNLIADRNQAGLVRDLGRDRLNATSDLERDLFIANIDERNRALDAFEGLSTGLSQRGVDRTLAGGSAFNQALLNRDLARAEFGLNAAEASNRQLLDRQRFEEEKSANRLSTLGNTLFANRADQLNRRLFNLDQLAREKQGQLGLIFGAGQFGAQQQAQRFGNNIANQQLAFAQQPLDFGFDEIISSITERFDQPLPQQTQQPTPVNITPRTFGGGNAQPLEGNYGRLT